MSISLAPNAVHEVIDFETLALTSNAYRIALGSVRIQFFPQDGKAGYELHSGEYTGRTTDSPERTCDPKTVHWWMNQALQGNMPPEAISSCEQYMPDWLRNKHAQWAAVRKSGVPLYIWTWRAIDQLWAEPPGDLFRNFYDASTIVRAMDIERLKAAKPHHALEDAKACAHMVAQALLRLTRLENIASAHEESITTFFEPK